MARQCSTSGRRVGSDGGSGAVGARGELGAGAEGEQEVEGEGEGEAGGVPLTLTSCFIHSHSSLVSSNISIELYKKIAKEAIWISVWKSGPRTGKRPGLDWTRTSQDRKSQDRTGLQPQSGLQSFAISRIPGPVKDRSGPVRTSLLIGKFINILSIFRTLIY